MRSDDHMTSAPRPPRDRRCPVCGSPIGGADTEKRRPSPFCSRACADVDLLRWLRGGYVIAGSGSDDDEDGETGRAPAPAGERRDDTDTED